MTRGRLLFLSLSLATLLLLTGGRLPASTGTSDDGSDSLYKYLSVFTEVLSLVKRAYVDETELNQLMSGAFEGTSDALDQFSHYIPSEQVDRYLASQEVGAGRSGILVLKERGMAYVASVIEGSPAVEAGLALDDVISTIGGRNTREMPLWEIQSVLAGEVGTEVVLERIRLAETAEVRFELAEVEAPPVQLVADQGVGVLRINSFDGLTPERVAASLSTLLAEPTELPDLEDRESLVMDLRGVAGGDAESAYRVAALFAGGELGSLKAREEVLRTFSNDLSVRFAGRIAVLVNHGTQGPAEILASILRQAGGAELVGERTFGHSGRQSLVPLSNGGRLQITDAFYTGPDQEPIKSSLEPDHRVILRPWAAVESEEGEDPILRKALEVLAGEVEEEQVAA